MLNHDDFLDHIEWLLNEGETDRATALCRKGLRRFPKDQQLWYLLGDSLLDSGKLSQAEEAFKNASEIKSDWALPLAKRAETLAAMGQTRKAEGLALKSYSMDRDNPYTNFVRAILYELAGEYDIALFFYRRAERLDPEAYFAPVVVNHEEFMEAFEVAREQLKDSSLDLGDLDEIRWLVLERVDEEIPELKRVSPMAPCHFVATDDGRDVDDEFLEDDLDIPREPRVVELGFVFKRNILRVCRNKEDLYTQIYLCLLEELE